MWPRSGRLALSLSHTHTSHPVASHLASHPVALHLLLERRLLRNQLLRQLLQLRLPRSTPHDGIYDPAQALPPPRAAAVLVGGVDHGALQAASRQKGSI